MMSAPISFRQALLALCLALAATAPSRAGLVMAGHLPPGTLQPLEAGDAFTMPATRVFLAPAFADSSFMLGENRRVSVLGARGNFYQLKLETSPSGAPARTVWVYRSELEVTELAKATPVARQVPADLTRGLAERAPAAGDTLALAGVLLYQQADLLAEHELLAGRQVLRIVAAENTQGFLKVRTAGGRTGWLHRAELPETRRLLR